MPTDNSLYLNINQDKTNGLANVVYNGFRFPLGRHSSVSFSPEMSDDGRTIKYIRLDLHIEFIWVDRDPSATTTTPQFNYAARNTDLTFPTLRQLLLNPGQPLRFVAEGVGEIRIQENGYYDVNNGPKPKIVSSTPIAGGLAHEVVWECSAWSANCTGVNGLYGIAQFPYSVSWNIGTNGVTTRAISGLVEIPLSRLPIAGQPRASKNVTRTADEMRETIIKVFPPMLAYERSHTFNLSADRKTLSFTITDTEIPSDNPYFPGIVKMSIPRRYSSSYKSGFNQWQGSVSGTIEVAPGYHKLRAWIAFVTVFNKIFGLRTKGKMPTAGATESPATEASGSAPATKESWGILTSISIEEELFGRTMSFSFEYRLLCTFAELFNATGLFQPLNISNNEASWELWRTSIEKIQGPRGWRGLQFKASDDVIVDLCDPSLRFPQQDHAIPATEERKEKGAKPEGIVDPKKSYVYHECDISCLMKEGSIYSIPLEKSTPVQEYSNLSKGYAENPINFASQEEGTRTSAPVINRVRPPVYKFVLTGKAIRVGYQPAIPNLRSIGGRAARKHGTDVITSKQVGTGTDVVSGLPLRIYAASWRKEYILEDRPQDGSIDHEGRIDMYT